ncbi:amino acid kinase family protein [Picrophilus oshimae]|uniref:Aspartate kinase n=1 Tax=Picrophilus torridus (strain ATCC 700027 / DSM 9790 / JCM 10055 / NBRC 100828 / KAW 2/3) TaxID=1122961 RepID=Q6KZ99_PICTO|nr:aspartokinase [Picrophilus oshimae]AAT43953.1 aspartokinase [Picrophilus oshimae DSM 9789]SMD30974.1 aspartate kinase [Picrophilus oshimae DSM 9789]
MEEIVKIGGSILTGTESIERIAELFNDSRIIVTSALKGVTDRLIRIYNENDQESLKDLIEEHKTILTAISDNFDEHLKEIANDMNYYLSCRYKSAFITSGERLAALILYAAISKRNDRFLLLNRPVIITDDSMDDAYAIMDETEKNLKNLVGYEHNYVIPGFMGLSRSGRITSLGRGGSDYSATVIARALNINVVRFITDVPGIMTADPKVVKNAYTVKEVSIYEAMEMARFGVKKFNRKTFEPVLGSNIEIRIESLVSGEMTLISNKTENTVKCLMFDESKNSVTIIGHGILNDKLQNIIITLSDNFVSNGLSITSMLKPGRSFEDVYKEVIGCQR